MNSKFFSQRASKVKAFPRHDVSMQWHCLRIQSPAVKHFNPWTRLALSRHMFTLVESGTLFQYQDHLLRYRGSRYKDKTISQPFYLYKGNPFTGKIKSLYWISPYICSLIQQLNYRKEKQVKTTVQRSLHQISGKEEKKTALVIHWSLDEFEKYIPHNFS